MFEQGVERLWQLGIKAVLFDLDDTLLETGVIFQKQMEEYAFLVSDQSGLSERLILSRLSAINNEEYLARGVSPERWRFVVSRLREEFDSPVVVDNLPVLMDIYNQEPRVHPGATNILRGLRIVGMSIGVVTHANEGWTNFKLRMTGLEDYVDQVEIANEDGVKSAANWFRMMKVLGVKASQSLVVGDSLKGDILPATELGARAMMIPAVWSVYSEGEIPEKVVTLAKIGDFYKGVMELV